MRQAALASFAAKNRNANKGGVAPVQAVTGRNTIIPGSLISQISTARSVQVQPGVGDQRGVGQAERIRIRAMEAYRRLDSQEASRSTVAGLGFMIKATEARRNPRRCGHLCLRPLQTAEDRLNDCRTTPLGQAPEWCFALSKTSRCLSALGCTYVADYGPFF